MTAEHIRDLPELPSDIQKIHIVGICGTAMGSLAAMLKTQGFDVRGSDAMAYPPMSTWLEDQQISIMMGYAKHNLDWNPDLVIIGNVVRATYEDAVAARERNIPTISLPEALRIFFLKNKKSLVITGTHGKTTTTSMLAWITEFAKLKPSFMVGGITGNFQSNYQIEDGEHFVIEGDEYDTAYFDKVPKFWHYQPFRAAINNIEYDHADIYPDIEAIEHVFTRLVQLIPSQGSLWVNGDDSRAVKVAQSCTATVSTFGLGEHNDLRATDIAYDESFTTAQVSLRGEDLGTFKIPTLGEFNVRNMLGAIAIAMDEGVSVQHCKDALAQFKSVKKRQELIGVVNHITILDDFAHHPTAVESTVTALRTRYPNKTLRIVFEAKSNTSRRKVFQQDYPKAFALADEVILSKPWKKDTLPKEQLLDIDELHRDIEALGPKTSLMPNVDDIVDYLAKIAQPGDIIAGLSGSAFDGFHQKLLTKLKEKHNT